MDKPRVNRTILFPMFTASSYEKSGELVPAEYRSLEERSAGQVSRIISPSYTERDILVKDYKVDNTSIAVIPRSVGCEFSKSTRTIGPTIHLIYVASVRLQKNHMAALRVVNCIKKAGLAVQLTCAGAIQDEQIYGECLDYIRENMLTENVFFAGNKTKEDIRRLFAESDINVSVSNWETFGRGIYEGMSAGLPTVILNSLECVINAENIGVYPVVVNTEEQMASEIIRLAADTAYYESESKKRLLIQKKLCFEVIAGQLQAIIAEMNPADNS